MTKTVPEERALSVRNTPPWRKRAEWLLRAYGITMARYEDMWLWQGGRCAICQGTNKSGHALAVDHDHATGVVRGLLCVRCNADLHVLETPGRLDQLGGYLER